MSRNSHMETSVGLAAQATLVSLSAAPGRALQLMSAAPIGRELQFPTSAFGRAEEVEKI